MIGDRRDAWFVMRDRDDLGMPVKKICLSTLAEIVKWRVGLAVSC
jgi:hypothetical protein